MQLPVWILKMIIIMISYVDYTTSCTPVRKLCRLRLFSILLIFKFKTRILRFRERRASLVLVLNCPSLCSETLRPPFLDDRWSLNMRQSVRASLVSLYIYILFVCKITSSRHPEKLRFAHWRFDSFCGVLSVCERSSSVAASERLCVASSGTSGGVAIWEVTGGLRCRLQPSRTRRQFSPRCALQTLSGGNKKP